MSFLLAVIAFLLLLGPLVVIHELGHLLAAKAVGVHAPRFSIGFGTPFWRRQWGETEYCVAPIPLGGYVALLGQNPHEDIDPELAERSLANKPLWARMFVIAAGPLTNFILPYVIYFGFFLAQSTVPAAIVGSVYDGSAAQAGGMQSGDRIVRIDGEVVDNWRDLRTFVGERPGLPTEVEVEREGKRVSLQITPTVDEREGHERGLLGVQARFYDAQISVLEESPAARSGLRTGDVIRELNGRPTPSIGSLLRLLDRSDRDRRSELVVDRPTSVSDAPKADADTSGPPPRPEFERVIITLDAPGTAAQLGVHRAQTTIARIDPDSPAARAGLRVGDRIIRVDGQNLRIWESLGDAVAHKFDHEARTIAPLDVVIASPDGTIREMALQLEVSSRSTSSGQRVSYPVLGAYPHAIHHSPEPLEIQDRWAFAWRATPREIHDMLAQMLNGLRRMVTRREGLDDIAGPLGMMQFAAAAAQQGASKFLQLMAIISLNLGIVNLLPIPVLDGGHLLFFGLEGVLRRPLGQRAREIASAVGLTIIAILMLLAMRNDIKRLWPDDDPEPPRTSATDSNQ